MSPEVQAALDRLAVGITPDMIELTEIAAEVRRLEQENRDKHDTAQEFLARAEKAEADAAALRKALEPFGKRGQGLENTYAHKRIFDDDVVTVPVGDLRRAARALKGQP